MLEYIPISIALAGSSLAGVWDLKTTEIPDWIPHLMIVLALVFWGIQSYFLNDYWPIAQSLMVGLSFLGTGFLMYYFGQWGGGDAKILSATGFLVPGNFFSVRLLLPFPLSYVMNVFLIGAVYMIVYALVLAVRDRKITSHFYQSVKSSSNTTVMIFSGISVLLFALTYYINMRFGITSSILQTAYTSITISSLYIVMFLLWKFVLSVERVGFRKTVSVGKLRVGDVLLESKFWEGMTEKDIARIRKSGKKQVVVKDGVRFGIVFPIALAFTLFVGDFIIPMFNLI